MPIAVGAMIFHYYGTLKRWLKNARQGTGLVAELYVRVRAGYLTRAISREMNHGPVAHRHRSLSRAWHRRHGDPVGG
jgi:hypothetical protein